jgi:hypothetical protein
MFPLPEHSVEKNGKREKYQNCCYGDYNPRQIKGNSACFDFGAIQALTQELSFLPEPRFLKRVHPLLVLRGFKSYVRDAEYPT